MKISFIVPVYKVEKYLRRCVESLTCQTYKHVEIILVDDGSPDGCPALCDQLAIDDNRIRVIHKENGGLSDARNAGLEIATGDYVIFVDSDDFWVGSDSLHELVDLANEHPECDFIGFNCSYYYEDTGNYSKWVAYPETNSLIISGDEAMQLLVANGTFPMSACLKLIKRKFLLNGGILFKAGQIAEDIPWFINLLECAKSCMFINDYIYAYRQNVVGSITNSFAERSFINLLNIVKTELSKIESRGYSDGAKDALRSFLAYEVCIMMAGVQQLPKERQSSARKELVSLCWLLKYRQNPKVQIASKVYGIFGFAITERVLRGYNRIRLRKR